MHWSEEELDIAVHDYCNCDDSAKKMIASAISSLFSFDEYKDQLNKKESALENTEAGKSVLSSATQLFPDTIASELVEVDRNDLRNYGIVITAGGEGERLKVTLQEQGFTEEELVDFTKATWPLPNFTGGFGALQINLALIASLSEEIGHDIPVIVTTGPEGTTTARVIPEIIKKANNFGLKKIKVIAQSERLHLTVENKIAWKIENNTAQIATNPDETGGPLMKLLEVDKSGKSPIKWIESNGANRVMVLQGTAVYNPVLVEQIASAGINFDGMGIGISRDAFPASDPYGTFVLLDESSNKQLRIIEKNVRNAASEKLQDDKGKYLPFNTGFYTFTTELISKNPLPDYAVPQKDLFPGYDKADKVGYAATDVIAPAQKSGVLTIPTDDFAVIKTSDDLPVLTIAAKKFNLHEFCH